MEARRQSAVFPGIADPGRMACGARAPKKIVVTLQWEVARRLMAGTDDDDYGILTLLVQRDFEPRDYFKIPRGCFFPEPDVDSACVVLERRAPPLLPDARRANFAGIGSGHFTAAKNDDKIVESRLAGGKFDESFTKLKIGRRNAPKDKPGTIRQARTVFEINLTP